MLKFIIKWFESIKSTKDNFESVVTHNITTRIVTNYIIKNEVGYYGLRGVVEKYYKETWLIKVGIMFFESSLVSLDEISKSEYDKFTLDHEVLTDA